MKAILLFVFVLLESGAIRFTAELGFRTPGHYYVKRGTALRESLQIAQVLPGWI